MVKSIIPVSALTEEDIQNRKDHIKAKNFYNKYDESDLRDYKKVNLYELLDIDHLRNGEISTKIIDYCTVRMQTFYHPLRNDGKQDVFCLVKKAQKILSNPLFRKVYDSAYLDESLPEDREYDLPEFIEVFSNVFERNGYFSEYKPLPSIEGDVEAFYKFWVNFKTTRVYDNPDDVIDVSGGMRRDAAEKNKAILQQKKLKDLQRIQELVKLAIKRDPRIKKKNSDSSPWTDQEVKSLQRFDVLFGKTANKFDVIAKKLNEMFITKRTSSEIKTKIEEIKKK